MIVALKQTKLLSRFFFEAKGALIVGGDILDDPLVGVGALDDPLVGVDVAKRRERNE